LLVERASARQQIGLSSQGNPEEGVATTQNGAGYCNSKECSHAPNCMRLTPG
jgi:hypothetical protein